MLTRLPAAMPAECIPLLDAASTDRAGPLGSSRLRHLLTYLRRQLVPTPGSRARPETAPGTPVTYRCCLRSMVECDVSSVAVLFSSASSREAAESYRGDHRCGFGVLVGPLRHRLRTSRHSVHLGRANHSGTSSSIVINVASRASVDYGTCGWFTGPETSNPACHPWCRRDPGRFVGTNQRP
jgi:hypothetical protein